MKSPLLLVAAVYDPGVKRYRLYKVKFLCFGSLASVVWPLRVSETILCVLSQLGIIAVIHVDDAIVIMPLGQFNLLKLSLAAANIVFGLMAMKMSHAREESHLMQESLVVLGLGYTIWHAEMGFEIAPPMDKIRKAQNSIVSLLIKVKTDQVVPKGFVEASGMVSFLGCFRRWRTLANGARFI